MLHRIVALIVAAAVAACTSVYSTPPGRTATEELLVSTAADRAADGLADHVPPGEAVYLDTSALDGQDSKYAAAAIADRLLRHGVRLVEDRNAADSVIVVRSGALSTEEDQTLIGLPSFPMPFLGTNLVNVPELDVFKETRKRGVAQFSAVGYDRKTGKLLVAVDPQFGFSHRTNWVILFLFSWERDDIKPDSAKVLEADDKSKWRGASPIRYLPIRHYRHAHNVKP